MDTTHTEKGKGMAWGKIGMPFEEGRGMDRQVQIFAISKNVQVCPLITEFKILLSKRFFTLCWEEFAKTQHGINLSLGAVHLLVEDSNINWTCVQKHTYNL